MNAVPVVRRARRPPAERMIHEENDPRVRKAAFCIGTQPHSQVRQVLQVLQE